MSGLSVSSGSYFSERPEDGKEQIDLSVDEKTEELSDLQLLAKLMNRKVKLRHTRNLQGGTTLVLTFRGFEVFGYADMDETNYGEFLIQFIRKLIEYGTDRDNYVVKLGSCSLHTSIVDSDGEEFAYFGRLCSSTEIYNLPKLIGKTLL